MRLLVTGGSGYLGSELVSRAEAAGWDVTAVGSKSFDVRDAEAADQAVAAVGPDAVVHTAYRQDGPGFREINVAGSRNVARVTRNAGARLIHMSTDVVFDGRAGRPYVEGDRPCPITDYGRSKAEAEHAVAREHPDALLVRTSLIYGGDFPSKHELAAREPGLVFFTDELRCPVQVGDLADALVELLALRVAGPLHVAGADGVSRWEFARLAAGRDVPGARAPSDRPLDCRLDSTLARSLLRTRLRGVREVLG